MSEPRIDGRTARRPSPGPCRHVLVVMPNAMHRAITKVQRELRSSGHIVSRSKIIHHVLSRANMRKLAQEIARETK